MKFGLLLSCRAHARGILQLVHNSSAKSRVTESRRRKDANTEGRGRTDEAGFRRAMWHDDFRHVGPSSFMYAPPGPCGSSSSSWVSDRRVRRSMVVERVCGSKAESYYVGAYPDGRRCPGHCDYGTTY